MGKLPDERAEAQAWAERVQILENRLQAVKDICHEYGKGLITADECVTKIEAHF